MVAHRNYRRAVLPASVAAAPFRMPGAPFANWAVLAFLVLVSAMLWLDPDTRVALYVAPFWFGLLGVGYLRCAAHLPETGRNACRLHQRLAAADDTAAVDHQGLAGDEVAGARGEQHRDSRDVVGIAEPAQRAHAREQCGALVVLPQRAREVACG